MALISKIRERTGLAVGIVAFGLILFLVGGDILGPNSMILGKNKTEVGEIAGETIGQEEYVQQIEELKYNFTLNFGRNPSESDMLTIRQQAWDYLIVKKAFQKEYEKLGLEVTEEELVDMVQGRNIHPDLVQAFTNPETGEFQREQIISFLQNINSLPPQQQAGWYLFESNLRPSRLRLKYDYLLTGTNYITKAEAEQQYHLENDVAEVKYMYIPYYTVSDSLIEVTEEDLRNYFNEHKNEYKVEETRTLNYVSFPIIPSSEDTTYTMEEINELADDLGTVDDDSIFARINTDGNNPFGTFHPGQLPLRLRDQYEDLKENQIIGPYFLSGNYVVHKVSEILEDTTSYARASHILIRAQSDSDIDKAEAKRKAQDLLGQLQNGANFAMLARNNSDDPSASSGGDLGWFSQERMVEPFSNAVFSRNQEGLIPRVVETEFGYHLINVTGVKTNKLFKVATIEREILPGDETMNEAFRQADYFASMIGNLEEFEKNAATDSLLINVAEKIGKNEQRISGLGDAREVIRWAFVDASIGEISEVFELEDNYVIAVLTDKTDEGSATLDDVRNQILPIVKNKLKAEIIRQRISTLEGTLDEIAEQYGEDASVFSNSELKLSATALPSVGFAPKAIGVAFALNEGEISEPIEENDGIVVIQLNLLIRSPEIADYTSYANQLKQRRANQASYQVGEVIREYADIIDERYKFF
ncbi:MAG: SurA N-terminal domain-containing protein [Cyclobacteriaceae bacterium]|nr:SurA N-terminal domain-containing protein [Cyclobacteriaceae bacterium]